MTARDEAQEWAKRYSGAVGHAVRALNHHGMTVRTLHVNPQDIEKLEQAMVDSGFPGFKPPLEMMFDVPIIRDDTVEPMTFHPQTDTGGMTAEEVLANADRIMGWNAEEN